jgi:hypothetical protein
MPFEYASIGHRGIEQPAGYTARSGRLICQYRNVAGGSLTGSQAGAKNNDETPSSIRIHEELQRTKASIVGVSAIRNFVRFSFV